MYARVNTVTDEVESQIGTPMPEGMGPPPPPPADEPGIAYYLLVEPINWAVAPSRTSVLLWNDSAPVWHEPATIEQLRAESIGAIDAAGEAMRLAVISNLPTQTEEYRQALQQAADWRAAGYPEAEDLPPPPDVASWAQAKWRDGWTARQAADDILATADLWGGVLSTIRALRLANKEDVRHATERQSIRAAVTSMKTDMGTLAQQLGVLGQYTNNNLKEV